MRQGILKRLAQFVSWYSTLPLIAVDLVPIVVCDDKLHQLATTQHVMHQERSVADEYVFARVVDVCAIFTQTTSGIFVGLERPHSPPAAIPRECSRVILPKYDSPDDAADPIRTD